MVMNRRHEELVMNCGRDNLMEMKEGRKEKGGDAWRVF